MTLRIKEVIKAKGMTVQEVADIMGINRVGLSNHINGNPSVEILERIAAAIGVHISELFDSKEELTALIQHKGDFYRASTLEELEKVVEKIKGNGIVPDHKNIRGKEYYQ
ncbi:MAG: helix-turn-helix domain-containing protein [Bacteroides sp.]|nr:helix-turn-helix domain-containing protein [Bacteroides sp.]